MALTTQSFTGWIEFIGEDTPYSREFVVANYPDDDSKARMLQSKSTYPMSLTFKVTSKNDEYLRMLDDLIKGDKVKVQYYLNGKSGISKAGKYYHLNELLISKKDGIVVVEKVPRVAKPTMQLPTIPDPDDISDDIPF
jgi:hypothetical protein